MQISDAEWQVMKDYMDAGKQTSTDLIKVLEDSAGPSPQSRHFSSFSGEKNV